MKHRFGETVAKAINTPLTNTLARTLLFPIPKTNGIVQYRPAFSRCTDKMVSFFFFFLFIWSESRVFDWTT